LALQVGHVVVREALHLAIAQPAAIDDRGVVVLVDDRDIVAADQRRDRADVGLVACRKD
jgi:hypothetical protein